MVSMMCVWVPYCATYDHTHLVSEGDASKVPWLLQAADYCSKTLGWWRNQTLWKTCLIMTAWEICRVCLRPLFLLKAIGCVIYAPDHHLSCKVASSQLTDLGVTPMCYVILRTLAVYTLCSPGCHFSSSHPRRPEGNRTMDHQMFVM